MPPAEETLSKDACIETYQAATRALRQIIASPDVTPAQRDQAREEFERINDEFLAHVSDSIQQRTQGFQQFVANMQAVLAAVQDNADVEGVNRLKEIVEKASALLKTA